MSSKKETVDKYVYRQIVTLNDGEKLPSVRKMMKDCNTSQLTVQTVLKKYEDQELIKASDRRGFYKVGDSSDNSLFDELDLIYCTPVMHKDPLANFHVEMSHLLGRYCGENWRSVRMHFLEGNSGPEEIAKIAETSRCRACVVVSPPSNDIGRVLNDYHISYVNLFPESSKLDENAVNIIVNNEDVMGQQMEYLIGLGHRKIALLHSLNENEIVRDLLFRRELFLRKSLENRLPLEPHWLQFGGYDTDSAVAAMQQIMSGEVPTAVICADYHIPGVYKVLSDLGYTPGENFSVVGTDNLIIPRIVAPPATTLDVPRDKAAQLALDALGKLLENKPCDSTIHLNCNLVVRQSTCPPIESPLEIAT